MKRKHKVLETQKHEHHSPFILHSIIKIRWHASRTPKEDKPSFEDKYYVKNNLLVGVRVFGKKKKNPF